ncbi:(S)-benzoin forming benzil reductase [Bacillus massilinigeriensis]|uniref:(S)-benzoin forming benzil reductase n=1 Tax=Bacillus massilionigeriensis TaxID=1805475 RepID=UPI00096B3C35|nr:(S)-benzoin forming benzil reductase [Bacillus massilionigeriensis]
MKLAIITGASKGLGLAIAKELLEKKIGIMTISRTENEQLKNDTLSKQLFYQHLSCDFSNLNQVEMVFSNLSQQIDFASLETIYLINNAGVVNPIHTVGNMDNQELISNIEINLIAPMLITNILLKRMKSNLTVINVTSGAAEKPYHGWSAYCSSKSGINMFSRAFALEQEIEGKNHKIIAFSPGIMDTDMQAKIRNSTNEEFHLIEKFKDYKENGLLRSPEEVASALIRFVLKDDFHNGEVYHVNDLL